MEVGCRTRADVIKMRIAKRNISDFKDLPRQFWSQKYQEKSKKSHSTLFFAFSVCNTNYELQH
jgi:hypothetical protein